MSKPGKKILITGATGMIGQLVLENCLQRDDVAKVYVMGRKTTGVTHPKLTELIRDNFMDYSDIREHLDCDYCFYCIGVYTGQVPNDVFNTITIDYTEALIKALQEYGRPEHIRFAFLSGQGADRTEKSKVLFAKAKGIAENILMASGFEKKYVFRPGYIYPVKARKEPNMMYKIMRVLYKPVSLIYPNIGLSSEKLASRMVEITFAGSTQELFENKDIRK